MTRQDFSKIADAFNRLISADQVNLVKQYPGIWMFSDETFAYEISDSDYNLLEPFFRGDVCTHYTVGEYELNVDGKIVNHGKVRIGNKNYIVFEGDSTAAEIQGVRLLIQSIGALGAYKRIPMSAIYGKQGA